VSRNHPLLTHLETQTLDSLRLTLGPKKNKKQCKRNKSNTKC